MLSNLQEIDWEGINLEVSKILFQFSENAKEASEVKQVTEDVLGRLDYLKNVALQLAKILEMRKTGEVNNG